MFLLNHEDILYTDILNIVDYENMTFKNDTISI